MNKRILFWLFFICTSFNILINLLTSGSANYLPCAHSLAWGLRVFVALTLFDDSLILGGFVLAVTAANAIFFLSSAIQGIRGQYRLFMIYMPTDLILSATILIVGAINTGIVSTSLLAGIIISTMYCLFFNSR